MLRRRLRCKEEGMKTVELIRICNSCQYVMKGIDYREDHSGTYVLLSDAQIASEALEKGEWKMGWEDLPPEIPTWSVTETKCSKCGQLKAELAALVRQLRKEQEEVKELSLAYQETKAQLKQLVEITKTFINLKNPATEQLEVFRFRFKQSLIGVARAEQKLR